MVKAKSVKKAKKTETSLKAYFTVQEVAYFQQLKNAIKLGGVFLTFITVVLFALSCYNFNEAFKLGIGSNLPADAIFRMWFKGIFTGYSYSEAKVRILNLISTAFMNTGLVALLWLFFYFIRREEKLLSKCWNVITGTYKDKDAAKK